MASTRDFVSVTLTVALVLNYGHVAVDGVGNCLNEIKETYNLEDPTTATMKNLLKAGVLNLSKSVVREQGRPYSDHMFDYLLTEAAPAVYMALPVAYCRKTKTEDADWTKKCISVLGEAKFEVNELAYDELEKQREDKSEENMKLYLSQLNAEYMKAIEHAYNNISPSDFENNEILKGYMELVANQITFRNDNDVQRIVPFCDASKCTDEIRDMFEKENIEALSMKDLLVIAILVLDKQYIEQHNKPHALKFYSYLFAQARPTVSMQVPLYYCRTKKDDAEWYTSCLKTMSEHGFDVDEQKYDDQQKILEDKSDEGMKKYLPLHDADQMAAFTNVYQNICRSEYMHDEILGGYMEHVSYNVNFKNEPFVKRLLPYCHSITT